MFVFNFRKKRREVLQVLPDKGMLRLPSFVSNTFPQNWEKEEIIRYVQGMRKGQFVGIEGFISSNSQRIHLISDGEDSHFQSVAPILLSNDKNDIQNMSLYMIIPSHASLFSFSQDSDPIWQTFFSVLSTFLNNEKILLQVLFRKRSEKWKQKMAEQYEQYLQGVERPSDSSPIFFLQQKLNEALKGEDGKEIEMKPLPYVEEKLQNDGFLTCIRLAIYGTDKSRRQFLAEKVLREIRKSNGENEWNISEVIFQKEGFLQNMQFRRFPLWAGKHNSLSPKEMMAWLHCPIGLSEEMLMRTSETVQIQQQSSKEGKYTTCLSDPSYDLLRTLPKGRSTTAPKGLDGRVLDNLSEALVKVGILKEKVTLQVSSVVHAPMVQRITFSLPTGVKYSQLQNGVKDLQTEMGIGYMGFTQGNHAGTVTLILPQAVRQVVYLRDWLETKEATQFLNEKDLPFFVGVSEDGTPLFDCLTRVKHLLSAGATGSGKSVWQNQLLLTLLIIRTPSELLVYLIDPKMVELSTYAHFPHVQAVLTEPSEAERLLYTLTQEMDRRYKVLADHHCRNIQQYNRKVSTKMPYLLIVIDEYADLVMMSERVEGYVIRLAQKARACGIHLIVTTQRPSVDVITGLLKANLPSRIVFACSSVHDYKTVLDQKPTMKLLGRGHGVAQLEGKEGLTAFQGAVISTDEDETDVIIQKIAKMQSRTYPTPSSLLKWSEDIEESCTLGNTSEKPTVPDDPLNRIKTLIAETGETRVSKLREGLRIRQNVVNTLMQELVQEGWLEQPETKRKGYVLKISEEERQQFLNTVNNKIN